MAGVVGLCLVVEVDEVDSEVVCCASDFAVEFVFCDCCARDSYWELQLVVVYNAQGVVDGHWDVIDHGDAGVGCGFTNFVELEV